MAADVQREETKIDSSDEQGEEARVDSPDVQREEIWFDSTDGRSKLHGYIWSASDAEPRGVVQLVHGMSEYIGRYDDFARFLAKAGFLVAGHDHICHGKSSAPESHGKLPLETGKDVLVGDVGALRDLMAERAPQGLPYFIFGHSMGSFVVRSYIAAHGAGLAGAIICGTGHIPPATSAAGNFLCKMTARLKGEDTVSNLLVMLSTGGYTKAIKDARTPLDWLSYDEANVDTYIADPDCGFAFSAGGVATLTALTREVCGKECFERVRKDLPLLFIAGDADPVGDSGKGVRTAAQMARDAGSADVSCVIYDHMRHEILNEKEHQKVYDDVLAWLGAHIA